MTSWLPGCWNSYNLLTNIGVTFGLSFHGCCPLEGSDKNAHFPKTADFDRNRGF